MRGPAEMEVYSVAPHACQPTTSAIIRTYIVYTKLAYSVHKALYRLACCRVISRSAEACVIFFETSERDFSKAAGDESSPFGS
jgi:hypothetical protein